MKSWLRDDRVYQAIMNSALWIVVISALSTTRWPQLSWVTGSITAVLVVIVTAVYWIGVVTNENDIDKHDSRAQHQRNEIARTAETQGQNVTQDPQSPPVQRYEILERYLSEINKRMETLRITQLAELHGKTHEVLRLRKQWRMVTEGDAGRVWTTNYDEVMLRNWLMHRTESSVKSHRRSFAIRTLGGIAAGEEDTSGKVVVMVGSVRIEIQEDDPNKTTNVHITSPKTVVTNVADTEQQRSQPRPQEVTRQRPPTTIH